MGGWNKGLTSWNKGLTKESDPRVAKISKSLKGCPKSAESKRKNSIAHQGRPAWNKNLTKETDQRVKKYGETESKIKKGKIKTWNTGKKKEDDIGVAKISEAQKGEGNSFFGKKHTEECKKNYSNVRRGKLKSEQMRKKLSEYHKKHPESYKQMMDAIIQKPTKPQLKLFEIIKNQYPNKKIVMEYMIKTSDGHKFIDIAIPDQKLGFEYDEPYWHKNKEKDQQRHKLIESQGWKLTHYSDILELKK